MKDHLHHIIAYKDSKSSKLILFGPFVSDNIANDFLDTLPEPLEGGSKSLKPLSLFQATEAQSAHDQIMRERDPNHPITQALALTG